MPICIYLKERDRERENGALSHWPFHIFMEQKKPHRKKAIKKDGIVNSWHTHIRTFRITSQTVRWLICVRFIIIAKQIRHNNEKVSTYHTSEQTNDRMSFTFGEPVYHFAAQLWLRILCIAYGWWCQCYSMHTVAACYYGDSMPFETIKLFN